MRMYHQICVFALRVACGVTLLVPVADRMGWLGVWGDRNISWGNWARFVAYTHTLLPFTSSDQAQVFSVLATAGEASCGLLFIIGLFIRWAALGAGLLTGLFALTMTFALGVKSPINFSVWVDCRAALLLATLPNYAFSLDALRTPKQH